jgi:hypothetical protein
VSAKPTRIPPEIDLDVSPSEPTPVKLSTFMHVIIFLPFTAAGSRLWSCDKRCPYYTFCYKDPKKPAQIGLHLNSIVFGLGICVY